MDLWLLPELMRGLWLEYMRSGIFGYLLYLCVFEIVYFHSCIDKYNIKKMWTCAPVLVVAWSDTFVRSLSRTTRALPEIDRVFHENEDILSETRAHVRTFQDQGLVYCGTLWSPLSTLSTQWNCCTVRMKAAAVIGRRTESGGSSLVFSGKPFILPSSSPQRHRL